ncbi:MAG: methionine adenosyltransferase [Gammaproteobacteria bacterium]|nr:methionine adenosyltransferase [Gammaproteobacteria bacterium]
MDETSYLCVESLSGPPHHERAVEVVERKGLGHPDTICDAIAEELSIALCRFYLDKFGLVLHHNVDKILLWAGVSKPEFGGGNTIKPIELFLAGRATLSHSRLNVPVEQLATECCHAWFRRHLHGLDPEKHLRIHCLVRPSSSELIDLYLLEREAGIRLSNDTSCGVGYAPLSRLERLVLQIEKYLNSEQIKQAHPEIGEDIKVMGIRRGETLELNIACAMISHYLPNLESYLHSKSIISNLTRELAAESFPSVNIFVNAADLPENNNVYLTVTGTSAESGDDGLTGRGNRVNGIITPYRPMTMEAAAGKNPITHVGKLYNVIAGRIAKILVEELPEISEAYCTLVSQIGRPIHQPRLVDVRIRLEDGRPLDNLKQPVQEIVAEHLSRINSLWSELLERTVQLY